MSFAYRTWAQCEHITASNNDPVIAGSLLMLNCTSMSNHMPDMLSVGPNGPAIGENGSTVEQVTSDLKSTILVFHPLQTSHVGNYICKSIIEVNFSTIYVQTYVHLHQCNA